MAIHVKADVTRTCSGDPCALSCSPLEELQALKSRSAQPRVLGMILAAVVLLGLFSARVRASTTWTVTTVADSIDGFCTISLCSLRDANAVAFGGDTITFDPSLNGQTITLTNGALTIGADGLTIQGPGANLLTISGAGGGVRRFEGWVTCDLRSDHHRGRHRELWEADGEQLHLLRQHRKLWWRHL